ncbi:MAG: hypothetical protein M0D57_16825 [Sphingobacteriales bacterium JAD_PAG50586_3]|nr:MAG: hypothetical protein M0D57_16825 [Sphingobacteriales bacterium JAD_PAG50586_3]
MKLDNMKTAFTIAANLLLCSIVLVKPKTIGERYLYHVNTYNADSLDKMLADDFILKRNFTTFTNNKQTFLTTYLRNSSRVHGRYDVVSKTSNGNPEVFLVENSSDVFTYLLADKPKWQLSVHTNKNSLVNVVQIDTVAGYSVYKQTLDFVQQRFNNWLDKAHPGETTNILIGDTTDLYTKRLIEFQKMVIED